MPTTTMAASLAAPPSAFDTGLSGETAAASMSLNGASVATSNITVVGGSNEEAKVAVPFPELEGKDPIEQLEILNALLEKETRIKEGAENLLKMPLADVLKLQVESELDLARSKIGAIDKRLDDLYANKPYRPQGRRVRKISPNMPKRKPSVQGQHHMRHRDHASDKDDIRTLRIQALNHIHRLASLSLRPGSPDSPSSASSSFTRPPPANEEELDRARQETMGHLVAILRRDFRVQYEIDPVELMHAVLPSLSDKASTKARAMAYCVVRHCLVNVEAIEQYQEHHLDWYIVKTLTRDNTCAYEREEAVKLIRTIVEVGAERRPAHASAGLGKVSLSDSVMRAIIAVAEHLEDPLRQISILTLAEILLVDIDLIARTGGLRVLLYALAEGPAEFGPILATTFLYVVDAPRTRSYFHPGTDLEIALSGITDAYGKGAGHADKMRGASKVISVLMRTWSGLMYLCTNDMLAIRSMINTLRIPSLETREVVLDMFFELLNIKTPEWYQTFIDGRRLTMYRRSRAVHTHVVEPDASNRPSDRLKLTDQYIALLTLILAKAGLLEALTSLIEESTTGSGLSRKAMLLMGEILHNSNKFLPLSIAAKIQTIPRVFDLAADYTQGEHRIIGTSVLSAIDSFNRNRARLEPIPVKDSRQRANSVEDSVRRGQRQVEQVKIKIGMQMDDRSFQASMIETQVMLTKDHTKWNFETLQDLIEGPLFNPKRLEEAIKVTRFIRRLMSFFHPFSHRFSEIRKTKTNLRWVKLGCSLLATLLANPDGVKYLASEDELLPQIVKGFAQLHLYNGTVDADPIFSKKKVEDTLTSGYFDMLGTLSKHKDGIELMEKAKVFTEFYHISELRSREDLIKGIIENMDYSIDGHARIVLSKALTSSYKHVRLYATNHLGQLIQTSAKANAWTLRLLLTQLYDPAKEVCELAVRFLEEACETPDILALVVDMHPTLEHLGEIGHPLLLRFMSTPVGFRYLYDVGYIEREMDMWLHERNFHYVVEVEVYLTRELNFNPMEDDEEDTLAFDGIVPPHFYGEMAKTDAGCEVLRDKGHFTDFAQFIRQHGLESDDFEILLKLKSILWAVGNIGATEGGLPFLEDEEIVPVMLEIAEKSPVLSVRGTCFYALGLISTTPLGSEILDDYSWEATLSPLGSPTGLCVPVDVERFVSIPHWDPVSSIEDNYTRLKAPECEDELEVITAISNLANTVIANAASRSLAKMKSKPEYRKTFSSPSLFYRVFHILSTQRYRLPVRRYILDLFEISLDSNVVQTLIECGKELIDHQEPSSSPKVTKPPPRIAVLGFNKMSESDGEDELGAPDLKSGPANKKGAALRPKQRIEGFDAVDSGSDSD